MKSLLLVTIIFVFLTNTAHTADTNIDTHRVAMGYSSTDDDDGFYVHTKNTATNSYFSCLLSHENGPAAAYYAAHHLLQNVIKKYYTTGEWQLALKQGFSVTTQNFCTKFDSASTAGATMVNLRGDKIIVAHVGDVHAILIKHKKPLSLTNSHPLNTGEIITEPSIQVVHMSGSEACMVIATAEYWRRRDITKTTDFCLHYLNDLALNTWAELQSHATILAHGLVNSVIHKLDEDKDQEIRVLVLLFKTT